MLQTCVLGILTSVGAFTEATVGIKSKSQSLISTGSVWENCDDFKKIPPDNTEVAIKHIDDSYQLITDAMEELKQTLLEFEEAELNDIDDDDDNDDDDDDDDEKWTSEDKKLLKPVNGLLMASKGLLKKIKMALKKCTSGNNNEIDELILNHTNLISPSIDDFVLLMYPPVDRNQLYSQGVKLCDILSNTLQFLTNSSIGKEEENRTWIEFIPKAVEHNLTLLKEITTVP